MNRDTVQEDDFSDLDPDAAELMKSGTIPDEDTIKGIPKEKYTKGVATRINKERDKRRVVEEDREVQRQRADTAEQELAEFKRVQHQEKAELLKSQAETLTTQAKRALDDNDTDTYFDLNQRLVKAQMKLETMGEVPPEPVAPAPRAEAPPLTDAAQDWLDNNRGMPQEKFAEAQQIESDLRKEGYATSDPDLYKELDRRLAGDEEPDLRRSVPDRGGAPPDRPNKARITREDLVLMKQYGLDPDDRDHRSRWLKSKGSAI